MHRTPPLRLAHHDDGGRIVVEVSGELDIATAPDLRRLLLGLVEEQAARHVVVDLAGLSFLGASGLHVLIDVRDLLLANDGSLDLRAVRRPARRVLEITGLSDVFGVTVDTDGAG
jgi:anti-sigma B factor antagonist